MSRITTPRPAIRAIRAASFMRSTSLQREVAHRDDNRENWRAYTGCHENRNQPAEPGEWREQEQHIIGMKAFHALEVECFHTRCAKPLQQFRTPHDEQHRTAGKDAKRRRVLAKRAVAQTEAGAEEPKRVQDHIRVEIQDLAAVAAQIAYSGQFAVGPVK